ncbi:hypothetical protein BDV59DRAFT_193972 [Aspergillus ambiguus]|uniref:fungal specific transcription factor domain-containing protein n=1 Tax=Aspergillus ambiguus TaxID=176160 RepID=UPI003CCDDD6B
MELAFHASPGVKDSKRAYTRGACDSCRQRKVKDSSPLLRRSRNEHIIAPHYQDKKRDGQGRSRRNPLTTRFLGNLNPIVFFAGDVNTRLLRGRADQGDVGIWLDRGNEILGNNEEIAHGDPLSYQGAYLQYDQSHGTEWKRALLPPRQSQEALVDIYFRCIHPILPLVDETEFRASYENGSVSSRLVQAICLTASKTSAAAPYLSLPKQGGTVALQKFSDSIYNDLTCAIAMNIEKRRITLIQILALLSLHAAGPKSFEEASMWLTQSIHHAFTLGLHLTKGSPTTDDVSIIALFWCLWSLDRWNGAIHGRPLVIHDRDLGQRLADVMGLFDASFRVWLSLASTLSDVTVVYRPTLEVPVDGNKPEISRFEEILDKCEGWNVPSDQLCSLELAYHGIALLASRPWGLNAQPKSRVLYLQQDMSVYRLSNLVQMCDIEAFAPLPTVAYCISLGFAISYKQLKRCHLPSTQHAAKGHIQQFCQCLETLSPAWRLAQVMVQLGKRAMDGMHLIAPTPNIRPGLDQPKKDTCSPRQNPETQIEAVAPGTDLQPPSEGAMVEKQDFQILSNWGNISPDEFGEFNGDLMSEDIDNFLRDFLNISIPTGPTLPFSVD